MKKRSITIKIGLLVFSIVTLAIVYGVHRSRDVRDRKSACYRAHTETLSLLEASAATINAQVQEIQTDQDDIDKLSSATDNEAVIQRRTQLVEGVKLKLTKINQDRAESQRRVEQAQAELSSCLAEVK